MMKLTPKDIINNIDVQGGVFVCWYDEEKNARAFTKTHMDEICEKEILFMYAEEDVLVMEVEEPTQEEIERWKREDESKKGEKKNG